MYVCRYIYIYAFALPRVCMQHTAIAALAEPLQMYIFTAWSHRMQPENSIPTHMISLHDGAEWAEHHQWVE